MTTSLGRFGNEWLLWNLASCGKLSNAPEGDSSHGAPDSRPGRAEHGRNAKAPTGNQRRLGIYVTEKDP